MLSHTLICLALAGLAAAYTVGYPEWTPLAPSESLFQVAAAYFCNGGHVFTRMYDPRLPDAEAYCRACHDSGGTNTTACAYGLRAGDPGNGTFTHNYIELFSSPDAPSAPAEFCSDPFPSLDVALADLSPFARIGSNIIVNYEVLDRRIAEGPGAVFQHGDITSLAVYGVYLPNDIPLPSGFRLDGADWCNIPGEPLFPAVRVINASDAVFHTIAETFCGAGALKHVFASAIPCEQFFGYPDTASLVSYSPERYAANTADALTDHCQQHNYFIYTPTDAIFSLYDRYDAIVNVKFEASTGAPVDPANYSTYESRPIRRVQVHAPTSAAHLRFPTAEHFVHFRVEETAWCTKTTTTTTATTLSPDTTTSSPRRPPGYWNATGADHAVGIGVGLGAVVAVGTAFAVYAHWAHSGK
jgi:hypothetical protein